MKLVSFSIKKYRSIIKANNIPISDLTILIGKNNEGKSNFLKALNIAIGILDLHSENRDFLRTTTIRRDENRYFWSRDFPIKLQEKKITKETIFKLVFKLTKEETAIFKQEIGSNLNGMLPIQIKIDKSNKPKIKITKTGRGAKTLSQKTKKIANFIGTRISYNYIPAIRTDNEAVYIIKKMVSKELAHLEKNEDYLKALETIKKLQSPILDDLSQQVKSSLSEFLPIVEDVTINIPDSRRFVSLRRDTEVIIDDGNPTNLEYKGDGIKSLVSLALLKSRTFKDGVSLVALEEPESHLHPEAIHQLKNTVYELSKTNQVIISTHNPLFVNRHKLKSNIIINRNEVVVAQEIKQIRDILGVRASDNLLSANFVVVVEGNDDIISLKAILSHLNKKIGILIKENTLVLEQLGGAGNLSYKLSSLKNMICDYHVFLDNDEAGIDAYNNAKRDKLLSINQCTFTICNGMKVSEFEDCLNTDLYSDYLQSTYGVSIKVKEFRHCKQKWSDRLRSTFLSQGKHWTDDVEYKIKENISLLVKKSPNLALNESKKSSILALVTSILNRFD